MGNLSDKTKILICQLDEKAKIVKSDGVVILNSPVSCLNAAITDNYDLIILCFSTQAVFLRSEIIELCICLKSNPLTRKIPLFASIDRWHRSIAYRMQEAGLDYMDVRQSPGRIDPEYISNRILKAAILLRMDHVMLRLCPFLNYSSYKGCNEITTCGAWQNRMVLGGKRLHEVCESENHIHCEYFLNMRQKS